MNNIQAEKITIGKNVFISPSATIKGANGKAKSIVIVVNEFIKIIYDHFIRELNIFLTLIIK
tara:strand:- start:686 stop:871 length:186 start_codon:yes stop_codon:yes gene_type:complete